MSFSATSIGELLRRHYPRAEGVIKAMIEAIQFQRTQGTKINEFDIINRLVTIRSKVKVDDEETNAQMNVSGGYPTYIPPTEPNGSTVKLYLFLDHVAETYRDHSGFDNHATLSYQSDTPTVDTDGLDLGNGHLSRALKFDSTKEVAVIVPDNASIRIAGLTTGFSLIMRVRLTSLANQGGTMRRLYVKRDDSSNSIIVGVDSTGKIEVHVEIANVTTRWETTNDEITANNWFTIGIVYNVTGPALTVYVNGSSKALTSGIASRTINDFTADLVLGAFAPKPYGEFDGVSDFIDESDAIALDLSQFSVAATFKTGTDFSTDAVIVNKGGLGSDSAGENMNYGLWMNKRQKIVGGFEDAGGSDRFVESPLSYNDSEYHTAVVTYDGTILRLYVDGVQVATLSTGLTPETNAKPLRIGANSRATNSYFKGIIDDIRVWNNDLTSGEVAAYPTTVPQTGAIVFEEDFEVAGQISNGLVDGNIQFVLFDRDVLWTSTENLAIHNNKWTKNPNVGSNKVAQTFFTLATTP